jgi:hypothetical protein
MPPQADQLVDETGGARFITKLDLASSYHQLQLRAADRWKTSFRTWASSSGMWYRLVCRVHHRY